MNNGYGILKTTARSASNEIKNSKKGASFNTWAVVLLAVACVALVASIAGIVYSVVKQKQQSKGAKGGKSETGDDVYVPPSFN